MRAAVMTLSFRICRRTRSSWMMPIAELQMMMPRKSMCLYWPVEKTSAPRKILSRLKYVSVCARTICGTLRTPVVSPSPVRPAARRSSTAASVSPMSGSGRENAGIFSLDKSVSGM